MHHLKFYYELLKFLEYILNVDIHKELCLYMQKLYPIIHHNIIPQEQRNYQTIFLKYYMDCQVQQYSS